MRRALRASGLLLLLAAAILLPRRLPADPPPWEAAAVVIDGASFRPGGRAEREAEEGRGFSGAQGWGGPVVPPPDNRSPSAPREIRLVTGRGTTVLRLLPGKAPGRPGSARPGSREGHRTAPHADETDPVVLHDTADRKENVHAFLDSRTGEVLEVAFPSR